MNEINPKYLEAKRLYLEGEMSLTKICKSIGTSAGRASIYLRSCGIEIVNKQNMAKMDTTVFEKVDTEEKAYWLGFLYADGYVGLKNDIELKLTILDYTQLEKFSKFFSYEGEIKTGIASNKAFCRLTFKNKKVRLDLAKLGCASPKSLTLTFPTEEQVPRHLTKHFVRGYVDGDGSIGWNNGKGRFEVLGTKEFLTEMLDRMDWKKNKISLKNGICSVGWGHLPARETMDAIYNDCNVYLDRKYEKYLKIKNAVLDGNV